MNVHNPFTTNLVVLVCVFNLYKMAKALNDMENAIHTKALSDICHVRVTQQEMGSLCIYLNEEVYKKLEDSTGEINQWIEDIGVQLIKEMYSKCMDGRSCLLRKINRMNMML